MRVQKLSDESHRTKIIFQVYGRAITLSQVFWKLSSYFPPGKPWIWASLTMVHITNRHLNGLRKLWCNVWHQQLEGKHPLNPCQAPRLETLVPQAVLPLPHHPCTICPKVLSNFTISQIYFLSKSPCGCPSSVLISHLHCWNVLLMGMSTSNLSPYLFILQILLD